MHLVESSSIRAIGYDEKSEELWIEFHSSPDAYVYFAGSGGDLWRAGGSRIEGRVRQSDDQARL
jgi:hypothetical protein